MRRLKRRGFTLIELLVVIAIIGVLIGLLLPAVQKVREAANRTKCSNNLYQMGRALHTYLDAQTNLPANGIFHYPTATGATAMVSESAWSSLARLLPYIEQENLYGKINFSIPYSDPTMTQVSARRIATYVCPSEPNDRGFGTGNDGFPNKHWITSYGVNMGTYQIFTKTNEGVGDGAFAPNTGYTIKDFRDGTSSTLAISEIKAYTTRVASTVFSTTPPAAPNGGPDQAATFGATLLTVTVETCGKEWVDGKIHETGFTTCFRPNTQVLHTNTTTGISYDVNFVSASESSLAADTYAAVTARSYHQSCVNVLLMDGSVRTVKNGINQTIWRALGTRFGGEIVGDSY